nr:hypothetical protein [Enterobacter roggenkampii]
MTEDADPSSPRERPRKPSAVRTLMKGVGVALMVLLVLAAALYLNRRAAARELLVGWLERKGVDADVEVERLEVNGFVGKISIGDPKNPDFKVERVEVDYALGLPWSKAGLGVTPSRVRLVRPIVRAAWKDGKLSLGSLDPLVERVHRQAAQAGFARAPGHRRARPGAYRHGITARSICWPTRASTTES